MIEKVAAGYFFKLFSDTRKDNEPPMTKKRNTMLLCLLTCLLLLTGCAKTPAGGSTTLAQRGIDMAVTMDELAGVQEYAQAMSASAELNEEIARMAAGDYSTPAAVYQISMPSNAALSYFQMDKAQLNTKLSGWLVSRAYAALPNMLIGRSGAAMLAASAVINYTEVFTAQGITAPVLYLYRYNGAYDVMAVFLPGSDGAVSGSVYFIPTSDGLKDCGSAQEVSAWLRERLFFETEVTAVSVE
ncbi:MAG: hypothetical protein PHO41_01460 [Eubacteriales bacterium]|nr:hypothetical protein [Eubacteriales bacterium]